MKINSKFVRFDYKVGRLHQNTQLNALLIPKKQTMLLSFLDNRGIAGWMRYTEPLQTLRGENYGGDFERSTSPATASDVNAFIVGAHAATWVQTSVVRRRAAGQMPHGATCYPVASCDDHNGAWKTHTAEGPQKCPHTFAVEFPIWSASVSASCPDIWCFMHQSSTSKRLDRCWGCKLAHTECCVQALARKSRHGETSVSTATDATRMWQTGKCVKSLILVRPKSC